MFPQKAPKLPAAPSKKKPSNADKFAAAKKPPFQQGPKSPGAMPGQAPGYGMAKDTDNDMM